MKRRVALMLLLLVAGAIVNVAVAWGLVCVGQEYDDTYYWDDFSVDYWPDGVPASYPKPHEGYWEQNRAIGVHRGLASRYGDDADMWKAWRLDAGWPLLGLGSLVYWHETPDEVIDEASPRWMEGIRISERDRSDVIPLVPVWPGFAINTLFYAGILWLLFAAPFALRRWRRIKRGLCPACAYPVGDSPVCTECGRLVPERASRASV